MQSADNQCFCRCFRHACVKNEYGHLKGLHMQNVSGICLKRTCLLDTSAFSSLEVLDDNRTLCIYLLT